QKIEIACPLLLANLDSKDRGTLQTRTSSPLVIGLAPASARGRGLRTLVCGCDAPQAWCRVKSRKRLRRRPPSQTLPTLDLALSEQEREKRKGERLPFFRRDSS